LLRFSDRHHVDIEWLITGNLKGLLRTVSDKRQFG
jgi:hypothetical protein